MKEVIINKTENDVVVYVLEENRITERYAYKNEKRSILGNIYLCQINKIMDGLQAAFANIGTNKNAFIGVKDVLPKVDVAKEELGPLPPISKVLKLGQKLLVQVRKEPTSEKGARISTHITLPGKYIVLMPETEIITVSQKIEDIAEVDRIKSIVQEVLPKRFGAIIRTDAVGIDEAIIKNDVNDTLNLWYEILDKSKNVEEISLLYNDHDIISNAVRDIIDKTTVRVYVNDKDILEKLKRRINNIEIKYYNENLIEKFGYTQECNKIDQRKIWLKSGGYIAIDQTEALTAIDVNSGKFTGLKDLEDTAYHVNAEAAIEIMRQLRLKDIGGIIVIDYIDMHSTEHEDKIIELMKNEAKKDRSKLEICKFTELNLVEMTRKKLYI